jgi:predicted dehydrogenase
MAVKPVRMAMIGCGNMARHHLRSMFRQLDGTDIAVVCEPSSANYDAAAALFRDAGLRQPPNEPDFDRLLAKYADRLDAVFIITPHAYHHDQAKKCLEAGLDVLLEKPMVMTAAEACSLIEIRDRTRKLLVVAFPGSLSPQLQKATAMLRSNELGAITNISATLWQNWDANTRGTWRQQPEIAGGGFLFDTGAHVLNTVAELAGEDFAEAAAWLDNRGRPVDILGAVMARLRSGALVTINACGDAIPSCSSDIRVFTPKAIIRIGMWGEYLEMQRSGDRRLRKVQVEESPGVWGQFLAVRDGRMENPAPPEVGLRMARLWDAIRASAAQGGVPVPCDGS